jgi:hypothetical protein
MDWTTNLIVQIVAAFAGAHLAATALHEYRFGWVGHSLVGLIAGALSGYFLQTIALTVVHQQWQRECARSCGCGHHRGIDGAVVGAIAMAAVGFLIRNLCKNLSVSDALLRVFRWQF